MKPKRFTIEPYKNALFLFCPCSKAEAEQWLKKKKIEEHVDLSTYDNEDAVTFYTSAGNFIFMHKYEDTPHGISILVHELCHATFNVLNAAGVKEEAGNEEATAYLLDNLTEKCIKYLRTQATESFLDEVCS
jgi:hypothetical protein